MRAKLLKMRLLGVPLLILSLLSVAEAAPPHYYKCIGDKSTAWGSCPEGCPTIKFRVKKGAEVKASHTASPWTWTWLEAWGTGDFTAECSCDDGTTWATAATYTVYEVTSLVWETYGSNTALDTCPKYGGKRIFPGKKTMTDGSASDRRKVTVKATVSPAIQGRTVYFKSWDVDDPSTNSSPVDTNGSAGADNRNGGAGTLSAASATTNAGGEATVTLTVSLRPGDNYRGAAACNQGKLNAMTQAQADAGTPPDYVKLSEMLTVWRKLWIDSDRMQADTSNTNWLSDTIDAATYQNPNTDLEVNDVPGDFEKDDHFNGGYIKIKYATPQTLAVVDFDSNLNDDDVFVAGDHSAADGKEYELYDDDYDQNLSLKVTFPGDADTSQLDAFEPAFVLPVIDCSTQDASLTFDRNVQVAEMDALVTTDFEYQGNVSDSFWGVHLICGFQALCDQDKDPDGEGDLRGNARRTLHGAFVWREVIRDVDLHKEDQIVIHEVGHCCNADDGDGGVMDAFGYGFTGVSLDKIRDKDWDTW